MTKLTTEEIDDLVLRATEGSLAARDRLLGAAMAYVPIVSHRLKQRGLLFNIEEAELIQEVALRLTDKMTEFDREKASFWTWVNQTVYWTMRTMQGQARHRQGGVRGTNEDNKRPLVLTFTDFEYEDGTTLDAIVMERLTPEGAPDMLLVDGCEEHMSTSELAENLDTLLWSEDSVQLARMYLFEDLSLTEIAKQRNMSYTNARRKVINHLVALNSANSTNGRTKI